MKTAKGDDIGGEVDLTIRTAPELRARAAAYLVRTDNTDLLVILGLAVESSGVQPEKPYKAVGGRLYCRVCSKRTQADGKCRRAGCGGVG